MTPKAVAIPAFSDDEKRYSEVVVSVVTQIVPGLARAFPMRTEVLLHDLTKFPNSIVAIAQSITGRGLGGPPTDLGVRTLSNNPTDDLIGYRTELDGLVMRSSSVFFHAPSGRTVVALCMNTDISGVQRVQEFLATLSTSIPGGDVGDGGGLHETFPTSVEMLAQGILRDAIAATGVSIDLMKKSHKLDVVRELNDRGFFTLRESVELAAKSLAVSRYSIYNYLNQLQGSDQPADARSDEIGKKN